MKTPRVLLGAVALLLGLSGVPGVCRAGEQLGPARPGALPEVLASVTILSDTAMAHENATGAQPAPVITNQGGHARVMLWDELKAQPELPLGSNGTVTLSTGGAGK